MMIIILIKHFIRGKKPKVGLIANAIAFFKLNNGDYMQLESVP